MKYIKRYDESNSQETNFRVFFQWGIIDEGVRELGEINAKDEKEAIEKITSDMNDEDKKFYRQYARAEKNTK